MTEFLISSDASSTSSNDQMTLNRPGLKRKSHSILTIETYQMRPLPEKRVKLNDQLSYCILPKSQNSLNQIKSSTILINSCNQKIGSEIIMTNKSFHTKKDSQACQSDYINQINTFPGYSVQQTCSYKMKKNLIQLKNSSKNSISTAAFSLDYQNLVQLFSNKHFSVQIIDYGDLQNKCISFVKNYTLKALQSHKQFPLSYFSSLQGLSQQNQYFYTNNEINKNTKGNKNQIQVQLMNKSQMIDDVNQIQSEQMKLRNNKQTTKNMGNEQLLINIQYRNIKEITGIQNIEFSQRTISKLINKFILFLKGDYRSLKYYDLDQKVQQTAAQFQKNNSLRKVDDTIKESSQKTSNGRDSAQQPEFNLFELLDEQERKEFSPKVQQLNKPKESAVINKNTAIISYENDESEENQIKDKTKFDFDLSSKQNEITECENEKNSPRIKQTKQKLALYNLSKYIMYFILELLSQDHLDTVNIPPGYLPLIQNVLKLMKKKGQLNENSQTHYYNHSHYNCLFLLLNQVNLIQIQKSEELLHLHQYIYEVSDILKPYNLIQINIIKSIISALIIKQFKIILSYISQTKQQDPKKYSNYQNYMITKMQYFERVYKGIQILKKGNFLVRF